MVFHSLWISVLINRYFHIAYFAFYHRRRTQNIAPDRFFFNKRRFFQKTSHIFPQVGSRTFPHLRKTQKIPSENFPKLIFSPFKTSVFYLIFRFSPFFTATNFDFFPFMTNTYHMFSKAREHVYKNMKTV